MANYDSTPIEGQGTVEFLARNKLKIKLVDALWVPKLQTNLLSVSKMTDHGFEVTFRKGEATVTHSKTGDQAMVRKRDGDIYIIEEAAEKATIVQVGAPHNF
ncbi:hypothetical protein WH47_02498 [Habropoda laboriosa]|uniref:Retrovirus-related Pol polyprotein from transposon TNT 1-94-like beta-barrel domain-containing protein n=1 Tax=Habropoda laboriosa TaxID=597456 RepID=A0A0L7QYF5_9HYME|nr:hypothetical protein WH47_02498 [Habropoda laboriosa]